MLLRPTLLTALLFMTTQLTLGQKSVGIFAGNTDVGNPLHKGSVVYDEAKQRYVIEGAGTNMWTNHPFYKHVYIRLMPMNEVKPRVIAYVYGGQGTINVPSWSPDSKRIAFVSNSQH